MLITEHRAQGPVREKLTSVNLGSVPFWKYSMASMERDSQRSSSCGRPDGQSTTRFGRNFFSVTSISCLFLEPSSPSDWFSRSLLYGVGMTNYEIMMMSEEEHRQTPHLILKIGNALSGDHQELSAVRKRLFQRFL